MSDEIKEEILDAPLVVHKKSDASYHENQTDLIMNDTHIEDDGPTLERHRFKKDPNKKNNKYIVLLVIIVIIAAVFAGLYFSGNIGHKDSDKTTTAATTEEETTSLQEAYAGTIVIRSTYIFVDGVEVDGIEGLQTELRYVEPSPTAYTIIDEGADSDFLNNEVLPLMLDLGFYNEETDITHKQSTGLLTMAEIEAMQNTLPPETEPVTEVVTEEVADTAVESAE